MFTRVRQKPGRGALLAVGLVIVLWGAAVAAAAVSYTRGAEGGQGCRVVCGSMVKPVALSQE